jgi:hypothetical protein
MVLALMVVLPVDLAVLAHPAFGLPVLWVGLNAWMLARAALTWSRWRRDWSG